MPRNVIFFLVVAGMLAAAVAAAIGFNSRVPIFVWFVATLAFEFWWRARSADGGGLPPPTGTADANDVVADAAIFPMARPWLARLAIGIVGAVVTALVFAWLARTDADVSLLGIPYWVPLGAAVIGNIAPRGLDLAALLFGGGRAPLRSVLALALLAMMLMYLFQYLDSGLSYADFIEAYSMPTTGYFPRSEFANVAPVPAFTAALQLAGYCLGAALLALPARAKAAPAS